MAILSHGDVKRWGVWVAFPLRDIASHWGPPCGLACPSLPQTEVESPLPSTPGPAGLEPELTPATPARRGPDGVLCPRTPTCRRPRGGGSPPWRALLLPFGTGRTRREESIPSSLQTRFISNTCLQAQWSSSRDHLSAVQCDDSTGAAASFCRRVGRRVPGPSSLVLSWNRSCSTIRVVSGFHPIYPSRATCQHVAAVRETGP